MFKPIKYFYIFIFLFLIISSTSDADETSFQTRFAVIADPHINSEATDIPNYFKLLYYSADILRITISEINAANLDDNPSNNIDFILFVGDNCDGRKIAYYKLLSEILNDLKVPFYMVPGDWDYGLDFSPSTIIKYFDCPFSNLRELVLFEDSGVPGLRKYDYSIDITTSDGNLVHLIGLDNVLHFSGNRGSYEPQQLTWLEEDLKLNEGKPTIILQHCPVLTPYAPDINSDLASTEWLPYDLETELSGNLPSNEFVRNIPWRKDRAADKSRDFLTLVTKYQVPLVLMADLHLNKKIRFPMDEPVSLLAINPALVSYPCAWTIYEMDDHLISWDVHRVEKYSRMSEEYDRRSLESFNAAFDRITGDKYQYNIEKTLALSCGEPYYWSGLFKY